MSCCKLPPSGKRDPVIWTAACYDAETGDLVWGRGWPYYTGEGVHQAFTEFRHTAGFVSGDNYRDVWRVDTQRLLDAETGEVVTPPAVTEPADGGVLVGFLAANNLFAGGNPNQGHIDGVIRVDPETAAVLWRMRALTALAAEAEILAWGKQVELDGDRVVWWHHSRNPATFARKDVLAAFDAGSLLWQLDLTDPETAEDLYDPAHGIEEAWWELWLRPELMAGFGGGFDPGPYDPEDERIVRVGAGLYAGAPSAEGVIATGSVGFRFTDWSFPDQVFAVPVLALLDWSDGAILNADAFPLREVTPPVANWKDAIEFVAPASGEGVYGVCPDQRPGDLGFRYLRITGTAAAHLARNCWPGQRQLFVPDGSASGYVLEYYVYDGGAGFVEKPRVVRIEGGRVTWQRQWPNPISRDSAVLNAAVHDSGDLIVLVSAGTGGLLTRLSQSDGNPVWSIGPLDLIPNDWPAPSPLLKGHTREAFGPLTISGDRVYLYGRQQAALVSRTATTPGVAWDLLEACEGYYYYGGGGGPATQSTDSFTGPNGQILGGGPPHHAPEAGPGWTLGPPAGPGYASLQGGRLYTPLDPIGEADSWIIRYLNGAITGAGQSQVSVEFEGTPLGNPQQAGVLFRLGVSLGTSGFLAVLETHSGGTDLRVSLYDLADHPSFGGSGGMPFPLASASVGVTAGGTLTVNDDGAWIGIDFNGVRKVTYQTSDHTSGSRRQGLFAYGRSGVYFDDWKVRGTAGCTGSGDYQWDDTAGEWTPLSGEDCTCSLLPPIRPGDFDEEIEAGRCGHWT